MTDDLSQRRAEKRLDQLAEEAEVFVGDRPVVILETPEDIKMFFEAFPSGDDFDPATTPPTTGIPPELLGHSEKGSYSMAKELNEGPRKRIEAKLNNLRKRLGI